MEIRHRHQLPELLRHLQLPLIAAEIGVAEGNFSNELLYNGLDKLYSVDAWEQLNQRGDGGFDNAWHKQNYQKTIDKLSKYGDKSVILKGLSADVAKLVNDNYFSLVYIDGNHSYDGVKTDIECWYPKLITGGIMAFHDFIDCESYGVKRAVYEFAMNNKLDVYIIPENKEEDQGAFFIKK